MFFGFNKHLNKHKKRIKLLNCLLRRKKINHFMKSKFQLES